MYLQLIPGATMPPSPGNLPAKSHVKSQLHYFLICFMDTRWCWCSNLRSQTPFTTIHIPQMCDFQKHLHSFSVGSHGTLFFPSACKGREDEGFISQSEVRDELTQANSEVGRCRRDDSDMAACRSDVLQLQRCLKKAGWDMLERINIYSCACILSTSVLMKTTS